jgi:hypothetical protein
MPGQQMGPKPDRRHAPLGHAEKLLQRNRHEQRRADHAGEEHAPEKARMAVQGSHRQAAEDNRRGRGQHGDLWREPQAFHERGVGNQRPVPAQAEAAPHVGHVRLGEAVDDERGDGQVQEDIDAEHPQPGQKPGSAIAFHFGNSEGKVFRGKQGEMTLTLSVELLGIFEQEVFMETRQGEKLITPLNFLLYKNGRWFEDFRDKFQFIIS